MAKKSKKLSPELIREAEDIFNRQGWPVDNQPAFDRFCRALEILTSKQRKLYLELTRSFLLYGISDYREGIIGMLSKIDWNKYTRIYVYPLLPESDLTKDKSSTFVHYQIKDARFDLPDEVEAKLTLIERPGEGLPPHINIRDDIRVVLVDDFIGTGQTALAAIKYLCGGVKLNKSKIIVLSLVAQQDGIDAIKAEGVEVYTHILRNKGISDNYEGDTRTTYLQVMESIERLLGVTEQFRFGYGQSEALVKLVRTPNNTFPVYWITSKVPPFRGIFPRKQW